MRAKKGETATSQNPIFAQYPPPYIPPYPAAPQPASVIADYPNYPPPYINLNPNMREKVIVFFSNSLEILGLNTHYEIDSSSPFFLCLQEKSHLDNSCSKQNQLKQLLETFQTSGYLNYGLREGNFEILTLAENKFNSDLDNNNLENLVFSQLPCNALIIRKLGFLPSPDSERKISSITEKKQNTPKSK